MQNAMIDITIKRLSLENFKCHRYLALDFNGGNASIYGDNATGKTSIYDALTWLLFGKDSRGNGEKNMEVKPLDGTGQVRDHDALTAVEVCLLVNGEEMTLRRTYREVWTTKRGSSQAAYDGNTSEYYVDGVPCKKNAFQDKVGELVNEDTFRMLTSVSYFANDIPWQARRAALFDIAGVRDDRAILESAPQFQPLLDSMGRRSLEDYKKKLLSERRGFVNAKTELPARISECQKTIADVSGLDFAGAREQLEILQGNAEAVDARLLAMEHNAAAEQKRLELRQAQLELDKLNMENAAHRRSQGGGLNMTALQLSLDELRTQSRRKEQEIKQQQDHIAYLDGVICDHRAQWTRINAEPPVIGSTCPLCKQSLPAAQVQKARDTANAQKQKRLDEVLGAANASKEQKAQAELRLDTLNEDLLHILAGIQEAEDTLAAAKAQSAQATDMPDYLSRKASLESQLGLLSAELAKLAEDAYGEKARLQKERDILRAKIRELAEVVNKETILEYARKRIEELREEARRGGECLEAIEKMLYLMEEFTRYKTRYVEDGINSRFRLARFRLFREQANGGVEDRCDVVYEGIPYLSVNNGMKINLGIDIINTLSAAYGVRVPLFVDNAECVTGLEECGSQLIRLVVCEKDKELRAEYEN